MFYGVNQSREEDPWASVDAFEDYIGRYTEAGMQELILQPPAPDRLHIVERIATDVLQGLRVTRADGEAKAHANPLVRYPFTYPGGRHHWRECLMFLSLAVRLAATFALGLAMLAGRGAAAQPQASPPISTPTTDNDMIYTAEDGWSVRINFDFWVEDETEFDANKVSLWAPNVGTLSISSVDQTFVLPRGMNGEALTFTDTRECLPWLNESFPELQVATNDAGSPLISESATDTWAIYISGVDDQTVLFTECRVLEPGQSYVWIFGSTPTPAAFNVMLPEISDLSNSLEIPGAAATPDA
jgi:hypothetical protein